MKLLTIFFVLTLIFSPVWAEWKYLDHTDDFVVYLDYQTIRKTNNNRMAWVLYNFKIRQKSGHISYLNKEVYDCKNETFYYLSTNKYSLSFGLGDVISSDQYESSNPTDIPPGSIADSILKAVCKK